MPLIVRNVTSINHPGSSKPPYPFPVTLLDTALDAPFTPTVIEAVADDAENDSKPIAIAAARAGRLELLAPCSQAEKIGAETKEAEVVSQTAETPNPSQVSPISLGRLGEAEREACQTLVRYAVDNLGVFHVDIAGHDGSANGANHDDDHRDDGPRDGGAARGNGDIARVDGLTRKFFEDAGFEVVARSGANHAASTSDNGPSSSHGPGDGSQPGVTLHMMLAHGDLADIRSGSWCNVAHPGYASVQQIARRAARIIDTDPSLTPQDEQAIYRELLGSFGPHAMISSGAHIDYGCNLFIGEGCFFNFGCTFLDSVPIIFEDGVMCGPNCTFATPLHPLVAAERAGHKSPVTGEIGAWERALPIVVKRGAWLASNVMVNPGVTVGEGSVIGSGSVVTKDIPDHVLAYGNPCRVARAITDADRVGV